jgi:CubicO group peptidase (beta-lactamase class C family)
MRIGEVLANDGVFEGTPLAPPHFVSQMLKPAHAESPLGLFTRVDGEFATPGVARLEAAGKQRLWIVPSLRLVVLRVGGEPPANQRWDEASIPDSIIRGTAAWQASSVSEGVDPKKFAPH